MTFRDELSTTRRLASFDTYSKHIPEASRFFDEVVAPRLLEAALANLNDVHIFDVPEMFRPDGSACRAFLHVLLDRGVFHIRYVICRRHPLLPNTSLLHRIVNAVLCPLGELEKGWGFHLDSEYL